MSDLVSVADAAAFLGVSPNDPLLPSLVAEAADAFSRACGREAAPFRDAQAGRVERMLAPSDHELWLDYGIADISTIKIGRNFAAPIETLNPDDTDVVVWFAGSRRLTRTDGYHWRSRCVDRAPLWVEVTYDTIADLPESAKLAVLQVVASAYRLRGQEGLRSETHGERSWTYGSDPVMASSLWLDAVRVNSRWILA